MLAVGPTMDRELPPHEAPPAGSVLYRPPPLQTPLCGPSVQVSPSPGCVGRTLWGSCVTPESLTHLLYGF